MGINENAEHACRFVQLDKSHSAHVSCEVVYDSSVFGSDAASFTLFQVEGKILNVIKCLIPIRQPFLINRPDILKTFSTQRADKMPADETTGASNKNYIRFAHVHDLAFNRLLNSALVR